MATVRFTPHLSRYFPLPDEYTCAADTLHVLMEALDARWPGLAFYLVDERGHQRKHVAIWVDGTLVDSGGSMTQPLNPDSQVTIIQALSGG